MYVSNLKQLFYLLSRSRHHNKLHNRLLRTIVFSMPITIQVITNGMLPNPGYTNFSSGKPIVCHSSETILWSMRLTYYMLPWARIQTYRAKRSRNTYTHKARESNMCTCISLAKVNRELCLRKSNQIRLVGVIRFTISAFMAFDPHQRTLGFSPNHAIHKFIHHTTSFLRVTHMHTYYRRFGNFRRQ